MHSHLLLATLLALLNGMYSSSNLIICHKLSHYYF